MAQLQIDIAQTTILVVDDEPQLTSMLRDFMVRQGFLVITAESAANALELLGEHHEVALVVTDMTMPDMSGAELATKLHSQFDGMPVVILSGYELSTHDMPENVAAVMQKPVRNSSLVAQIRTILKPEPTE
jgi:DNA-binding NtrC family response regulator